MRQSEGKAAVNKKQMFHKKTRSHTGINKKIYANQYKVESLY